MHHDVGSRIVDILDRAWAQHEQATRDERYCGGPMRLRSRPKRITMLQYA